MSLYFVQIDRGSPPSLDDGIDYPDIARARAAIARTQPPAAVTQRSIASHAIEQRSAAATPPAPSSTANARPGIASAPLTRALRCRHGCNSRFAPGQYDSLEEAGSMGAWRRSGAYLLASNYCSVLENRPMPPGANGNRCDRSSIPN